MRSWRGFIGRRRILEELVKKMREVAAWEGKGGQYVQGLFTWLALFVC